MSLFVSFPLCQIRGRKNFLPRMPLVMGIGLLFHLDDSCRSKHVGERRVRATGEESGATVEEDKFDQIGDLPGAIAASDVSAIKSSSSNKKKASSSTASGSSSSKKKKRPAAETSEDFDVTSNLRAAPAASVPVGRLTSEDEATDAEEDAKLKRIAQMVATRDEGKDAVKVAGKKKMSAAERKRMKKGGAQTTTSAAAAETEEAPEEQKDSTPAAAPAVADVSSSDDEEWGAKKKAKKKGRGAKPAAAAGAAAAPAAATAAATAAASSAPKPLPRGKRNKLKRSAARYAQQDEEDLVLAASLLGLQNVEKKKAEVAEREKKFLQAGKPEEQESSESEKEEEEEKDTSAASAVPAAAAAAASVEAADDTSKVCFLCKERGHIFAACPRRHVAGAADVTFAQARRAAETAEESEVAQLMAEEGVAAEDEGEGSANSAAQAEQELLGLTGRPLPDDLLHFILPVCAPYDALANYKYKLKLLPGAAKKGQSSQHNETACSPIVCCHVCNSLFAHSVVCLLVLSLFASQAKPPSKRFNCS